MMIKSEIKFTCKEITKIIKDYLDEQEMIREYNAKVEFESIEFSEVKEEKEQTSYLFPDDDIFLVFRIQEESDI